MKWVNLAYRLNKIFNMILKGKKVPDDYDWEFYTGIYKDSLDNASKKETLILKEGDYVFTDRQLLIKNNHIFPLSPIHHLVYETLLSLNLQSVMDIGSGAGDHLHNIQMLSPEIKLYGIDVSKGQVELANDRHPNLGACIQQYDITTPPEQASLPKVDAVYTMAVIQHIRENHTDALLNLFHIANKYVLLAENWKRHAFMDDISNLLKSNKIPWKNIYFYYREAKITEEHQNKPTVMIISSEPIPYYPVLEDYRALSETIVYM